MQKKSLRKDTRKIILRYSALWKSLMDSMLKKNARKIRCKKTIRHAVLREKFKQSMQNTILRKAVQKKSLIQPMQIEERLQPYCSKKKPQTIHVEEENQERYVEEKYQTCCTRGKPQAIPAEEELHEIHVKEKPLKRLRKEKPQIGNGDEKPTIYRERRKMPSSEGMEQMMVEKPSENAEMIQAVVNGNLPEMAEIEATDSNNIEGFKTDFIRSQGNKLIACLENIVSTMRQFFHGFSKMRPVDVKFSSHGLM